MRFILLLAMMVTVSAHASQLDKDIAKLATLAEVGSNGGEAIIEKYDVAAFNYNKIIRNLFASIKESDCKYSPVIGRANVVGYADAFTIFADSKEAIKILKKLQQSKQLKAALGYYWDGAEGYSEYCSTESMDLYFTNGTVLYISYDSTT